MNPYLIGNGWWCERCEGTGRGEANDRIVYSKGYCQFYDRCPDCLGTGRRAASYEQARKNTIPRTVRKEHTVLSQLIEYGPC